MNSVPESPDQQEKLKVFADLIRIYPEHEGYLRQYAKLLLSHGKQSIATDVLRQLHTLLIHKGKHDKADALAKQFPQIGRIVKSVGIGHDDIRAMLPTSMHSSLWSRLTQKRIREGHHLFQRGDENYGAYLVCEGELAEFIRNDHGKPVLMDLISAGDVIGEESLFHNRPWSTDVAANKSCLLVKLSASRLKEAMTQSAALKQALEYKAEIRRILLSITGCPLLQNVPLDMRRHLARESYICTYEAGYVLHRAGESLVHVDLISQGQASFRICEANLSTTLKTLKSGSLIGSSAAIHRDGCPADLVADSELEIVHISYAAFKRVVEAYPPLRNAIFAHTELQQNQFMNKLNEFQTQLFSPDNPA